MPWAQAAPAEYEAALEAHEQVERGGGEQDGGDDRQPETRVEGIDEGGEVVDGLATHHRRERRLDEGRSEVDDALALLRHRQLLHPDRRLSRPHSLDDPVPFTVSDFAAVSVTFDDAVTLLVRVGG